jgi:biopolymer transport protein ExbB
MRRRMVFLVSALAILLAAPAVMAQEGGGAASSEENTYFYWFAHGGGFIGYILICLSVVSTSFIIEHFITIRRGILIPEMTTARIRQMLESKQYRELLTYTSEDPSLVSFILNRALQEAPFGYGAMERAMENALHERMSTLGLKPEVLSILGNLGPLIGLYGTVMGIILAFRAIVQLGGIPEPGKLAGSIGVALVATFWGLTVAIPSLVVYTTMKNRLERYSNEAMISGREFLSAFRVTSERKPAAAPAAEAPKKAPAATTVA